jgi:hypothetical protein
MTGFLAGDGSLFRPFVQPSVWRFRSMTKTHLVIVHVVFGPISTSPIAAAIRPFVLYSLRHTFLTRLGESGCDAWTLARIAGHSSVSMSSRYVHPLRGCGSHGDGEIGWALNWAQSESDRSERNSAEAANSIRTKEKVGGRDRDRTGDPLLAKQVLSQLSYTPKSL